jgi:hypothetical protein
LLSSEVLLGRSHPVGANSGETGVVDVLTLGGREEARHPDVNADDRTGWFKGFRWHAVTRQNEIPMTAFTLDLHGLHATFDFAVLSHLHVTNPLEVDPTGLGHPLRAVAVIGPEHRVKAVGGLEPRIARRLARLDSSKEGLEGPVERAQGGLLGRERPRGLVGHVVSNRRQLGRLESVVDRSFGSRSREEVGGAPNDAFVGVASFLQGDVVQRAVGVEALSEGDVLFGRGA